jgi:DnaD/phage-associated family protein
VVDWTDRKTAKGGTYDLVDPSGPSTVENLVVACRGCSWKKAGRTLDEAGMRLLSGHVLASNPTLNASSNDSSNTSSNARPTSSLNRASNDPTNELFDDPPDEFDELSNESSEWHLPTYLTNQISKDDYKTYKTESTYKALERHLEPEPENIMSSSNRHDKNQELPVSNPSDLEGTEITGDGKENPGGNLHISEEPELGKLAQLYEEEGFGPITEIVREQLVDLYQEFGFTWVAEALREAVLQNKRRLKYVAGILENWRREGGMRRSDVSKGAATNAKAQRRSRADPEPVGRYIPDGPPEDPELDEFLRKVGFFDVPGVNC